MQRAQYLCDLQNTSNDKILDHELSPAFLMDQMDLREALVDAKAQANRSVLEKLSSQVLTAKHQSEQDIARLLDDDGNYAAAQKKINELMFLEKLVSEIGDVQATLDY